MCGIAGFFCSKDFRRLKDSLLQASLLLSHRGPDDSGLFFDNRAGVGLAHRRLSVIDLTTRGRQPMGTEDGRIHIVYNGEVYNFKQIRRSLQQQGYSFQSASDTEVILKAYRQWGIQCFEKFVGMFALAIWDARRQSLLLVRDRLGIKPIYYYHNKGVFLFASELKALMAFYVFSKEIDPEALSLFLHYQYVPSPKTIFKSTFKLMPGQYLIISGQNRFYDRFWKLDNNSNSSKIDRLDEERAVVELDMLLGQAVSDRMVSDVPLGALLSGGIDSSLVVAMMQRATSSAVKTFSIGFEDKAYNEAPWAARVAKHLGADHTELYVTPDESMKVIPRLPEIYDEPFADSSAVPTVLVCLLARSKVTVALSGDGGDEQFAGYVRYWMTQFVAHGLSRLPGSIRRIISSASKAIPFSWVEQCYLPLRDHLSQRFHVSNFQDKWQKLVQLMRCREIQEIYRMMICLWTKEEILRLTGLEIPGSEYERVFEETTSCSTLSRLMQVDLRTYLPDAMLTKVDRASMACGLEVRVPFLDHRVVRFSSMLSDDLKYRNGTGKYLLKKVLAKYLPTGLFERPKMGFGIPVGLWLRGKLKPLLLDYLSVDRLKKEGVFDASFVYEKVTEHLSGRINHQHRLWALLIWEMWKERWLR
ncbi:MAG: asparagine synthase (glutamine-hydrolyzing) [Deltaproteobacteria bacterium]|nr:asparagine synthase (glutamine-hydrolyzing) [Deltaproteobacteria bacterium]